MNLDLAALKSYPYRGEEDLAALTELVNRSNRANGATQEFLPEYIRQFCSRPDVIVPQLWEDAEGRLLAAVTLRVIILEQAEGRGLETGFMLNLDPVGRDQGLEKQLLGWALERTRQLGIERDLPALLSWRVGEKDAKERDWLESSGFEIARYFLIMEHPLAEKLPEPPLPPGFTLRTAAMTEPRAWADLYNDSFIDHWHHHAMTIPEVEHETSDPAIYRPEIDLAAVAPDGTYAGICAGRINRGEIKDGKQIGWIGLLGTRRGYRKIGLGRALLLAGMHRLQNSGVERVRLTVDADSLTGATRLYESAGFKVIFTNLQYTRKAI